MGKLSLVVASKGLLLLVVHHTILLPSVLEVLILLLPMHVASLTVLFLCLVCSAGFVYSERALYDPGL